MCLKQLKESPLNACDQPYCGPNGVVHTTCTSSDACKVATCNPTTKQCELSDLVDPNPNDKTLCQVLPLLLLSPFPFLSSLPQTRVCLNGVYSAQQIPGCVIGCATSCELSNKCLIGYCSSSTTVGAECLSQSRNCSSSSLCLISSCDTATGCKLTAKDCDDQDPCTIDSCQEGTGQCLHVNKVLF